MHVWNVGTGVLKMTQLCQTYLEVIEENKQPGNVICWHTISIGAPQYALSYMYLSHNVI